MGWRAKVKRRLGLVGSDVQVPNLVGSDVQVPNLVGSDVQVPNIIKRFNKRAI